MQNFNIKNGVTATFIKNERFNANMLAVRFLLPLDSRTVTENAMAAELISSCSAKYPSPEKLSLKLMQLYGAHISASTEKIGNSQLITLRVVGIKNGLGISGEDCFSEALQVFREVVFNPSLEGDAFKMEDVNRIKSMWCDKIKSEINDKRIYAKNRLEQIMFESCPYGVNKYGYIENAQNADGTVLYSAYKRLITEAKINISFVGAEYPEQFINEILVSLPDTERYVDTVSHIEKREVTEHVERIDITQGKLVMGFRLEGFGEETDTYVNAIICDIFGGGTYSKLFSEVREKMSLCYYCSARANRYMGVMFVESGVDEVNATKAKEAILKQLEDLKSGNFSDEVLLSSKRSFRNMLNAVGDSISGVDSWYGARLVQKKPLSPKEFLELIDSVTREQIIEGAKKITPDTIFYLLGKEEG